MSTGQEPKVSLLPEQMLDLATAMADRAAQSQVATERIAAEVLGQPFVETPIEARREAHLGSAILHLTRLEDPSRLVSLTEMHAAQRGGDWYARKVGALTAAGLQAEAGVMQRAEDIIIAGAERSGLAAPDRIAQRFARQLGAAIDLAEGRGVSVAEVYSTDDLYYAMRRTIQSPEADAAESLVSLDLLSDEFLVSGMVRPHGIDPDLLTEEQWAQLLPVAEAMREGMRQTILHNFVLTYGYDAFRQLPSIYDDLRPQMPLTQMLASVVPPEHLNDFPQPQQ